MMKRTLTTTLLAVATIGTGYGQCNNPFFNMEEGFSYEMSYYNGKDKLMSRSQYEVQEVTSVADGYEAIVSTKAMDKKDKLLAEGDIRILCVNDQLEFDIQQLLNSMSQVQNMEGAEVDVTGDHIIIPASLSVGTTLPESHTTMTIKMGEGGVGMTTMDITIKDRSVVAEEDIETPAGMFSCYKITQNLTLKMKVMGMGRTTEQQSTEWIAEGVGMVRSEQYNDKGKITSYSVLTSLD